MAFTYTNKNNLELPLAVFLMHDTYQKDERVNTLSATELINPLRRLILTHQNPDDAKTIDIADLIAARMGNAIHKGCEEAWNDKETINQALKLFGMSEWGVDELKINPTSVHADESSVYVEQRAEKELPGFTDVFDQPFMITGQYDLVMNGKLHDFKSTSVWTYIFESKKADYIKQGSIYRWLSPDKITCDYIHIHYIFTDWSSAKAREKPREYPQFKALSTAYPLWSLAETEAWLTHKVKTYIDLIDTPQEELPECSDEELWASQTTFKYYKDPLKQSRATKNFDTMDEALARKFADGDVGTIKEVPGEIKACRYCPVIGLCTQATRFIEEGRLLI